MWSACVRFDSFSSSGRSSHGTAAGLLLPGRLSQVVLVQRPRKDLVRAAQHELRAARLLEQAEHTELRKPRDRPVGPTARSSAARPASRFIRTTTGTPNRRR